MEVAEVAARTRAALEAVWVVDDVGFTLRTLIDRAFPGSHGTVYRTRPDGQLDNEWRGVPRELFEVAETVIPSTRVWTPNATNSLDDRVIGTAEVRATLPKDRFEEIASAFEPVLNGRYQQLRFTVSSRGRVRAWVGLLRASERDFDHEEQERLRAMQEPVRDHIIALAAAGSRRGAIDDAVRSLELFERPALILSEDARVLFANSSARTWVDEHPAALRCFKEGPLARLFVCHTLRTNRRSYRLAVLREHANPDDDELSPRLRAVRDLLLAGRSDRQIAADLGITETSARTYVQRLYRRLGIGNRRELWRRYGT